MSALNKINIFLRPDKKSARAMDLLVFTKEELSACPSQRSCRSWECCGIEKNVTGTVETPSCEQAASQSFVIHSVYACSFSSFCSFIFRVGPEEKAVLGLLIRICY